MNRICLMQNVIQEYAWGSFTAIPTLLREKVPSLTPQAELWMGAHPKAPSQIKYNDKWISLIKLIESEPQNILGKKIAEKYNNTLPFLFKILGAASPLSIQAHPNLIQAKKGFINENRLKIPLNAFNRNYKDNNHKPECICALTPFYALNGFRKISKILELMENVCSDGLRKKLDNLQNQQNSMGLKIFFSDLLTMEHKLQQKIILNAIDKAKKITVSSITNSSTGTNSGTDSNNHAYDNNRAYRWMIKIHKTYPEDIGIFSPLILNLIRLEPGQAMFLQAGELHTYLKGSGLELMANSDNVLRGGLTPKYIDLPELLTILHFKEKEIKILLPKKKSDFEKFYQTQAEEFALSVISIKKDDIYISRRNRNVEILICVEGSAVITDHVKNYKIPFSHGSSVIIPAIVKDYTITGNATIYKASVPDI